MTLPPACALHTMFSIQFQSFHFFHVTICFHVYRDTIIILIFNGHELVSISPIIILSLCSPSLFLASSLSLSLEQQQHHLGRASACMYLCVSVSRHIHIHFCSLAKNPFFKRDVQFLYHFLSLAPFFFLFNRFNRGENFDALLK